MTEATKQAQSTTSEMSDTERRRRLAAVYRLLMEVGQQQLLAGDPDESARQGEAASDSLSTQEAVHA